MATINRLLITGAAGGLGKQLRANATHLANTLRLSDIAELEDAAAHEELVQCDLGDFDAVYAMTEDVDAVVHLGGIALENTFENILNANIRGTYNVYEACRRRGIKRVVYASSNHSIGFYEREDIIGSDVQHRPDSIYGLSHVMQMRSAQFEYKDTGRSDVGLIAEELQPIIPELVGVNKEGQADSVSYDRMVSVLVKAIQELKAEVDSLKSQLKGA